MISCLSTDSPLFSVSYSVQSSLCPPPPPTTTTTSHGSNDTFGFEASILALFLKSANSGGTDSLSASSRKRASTHREQNCEARMYTSGFWEGLSLVCVALPWRGGWVQDELFLWLLLFCPIVSRFEFIV